MDTLGGIHRSREEYEQVVKWYTMSAEAGLPKATFNLGVCLDAGRGVAAPDYPAAAGWYRRVANVGNADAAVNLCTMYAVGRGWAGQIMPSTSPYWRPSFL
jgi:TPR repeat protein